MSNKENKQQLFRASELVQILGFSKTTFYKWIRERKFPGPKKFGGTSAWDIKDIEEWKEKGTFTYKDRENSISNLHVARNKKRLDKLNGGE